MAIDLKEKLIVEKIIVRDASADTASKPNKVIVAAESILGSLSLLRLARWSAVFLVLLTATFLLLSSFVFSWLNIIRNDNVLWVQKVIAGYAGVYWVFLVLNGISLLPAFKSRVSRYVAEGFLILFILIGLLLYFVYRLNDIPLSSHNLIWSVVIGLPLLGLGVHDLVMFGGAELWKQKKTSKVLPFGAAFVAGAFIGLWYFCIALVRYPIVRQGLGSYSSILIGSALLHGCIFLGMAAVLRATSQLLSHKNVDIRLRLICTLALFWMICSLILRKLVTPALSFNNVWADVWSWTYPICFIVMLAGWLTRYAAQNNSTALAQTEEAVSSLFPSSRAATVLLGIAALVAAFAVPLAIEPVDWNFVFQRLTAIAIWIVIFAVAWRLFARPDSETNPWKSFACLAIALVISLGLAQSDRIWRSLGLKNLTQASAAYHGMDSSLQVAQIALHPVVRDDDSTGLYPYLIRNALITAPLQPPTDNLVASMTPNLGPKPNIFIIVIDTMRRDYLSPYNVRVTFTPHIDAFAKQSVVFRHAYTNYGGTALSEPAIWAGQMIPSKHYVQPFYQMNALENLTTIDEYQRLITVDRILEQLLRPYPGDHLMNGDSRQHPGIDFRDAVREMNATVERGSGTAPIFVYTQPQNLHPVTLRELAHARQKIEGTYPGFNPRYADELHKVDASFGEFIQTLKAKGEFDNSIVILTSDHGDWLGEYGRWGHGQSLLPPIIEVPLLIHLPANMRGKFYCNPEQMVFLTDITPSLYYLLGHRDLRKGEFYGRPLFTDTAAEQQNYTQRYHLFMSSYAPVFGLFDETTHNFYVADAVDLNQSVYNLVEDHYGIDNLIDKNSQKNFEQLTRGSINRLNAMYGYTSGQ